MQAIRSEKVRSFPASGRLIVTIPSASLSAVSSESASRRPSVSETTSRSTTTSMVCFLFLSSSIVSSSSRSLPFTRTRTKPSFRIWTKICRYSPLRPRTTGARTWILVPLGSART